MLNHENNLRDKMYELTITLKIEKAIADEIIDNFIVFQPEKVSLDLIALNNKETKVYQPDNVKISLMDLLAIAPAAVSLKSGDDMLSFILVALQGIIWAIKKSEVVLTHLEPYLVQFLHKEKAYYKNEISIHENDLLIKFVQWYSDNYNATTNAEEIKKAISNLYDLKIIDITENKVSLVEVVLGKI